METTIGFKVQACIPQYWRITWKGMETGDIQSLQGLGFLEMRCTLVENPIYNEDHSLLTCKVGPLYAQPQKLQKASNFRA